LANRLILIGLYNNLVHKHLRALYNYTWKDIIFIFFSRVIIIVNVEMKNSMLSYASLRNYWFRSCNLDYLNNCLNILIII